MKYILAVAVMMMGGNAWAAECPCGDINPAAELGYSQAVFVGTVTSQKGEENGMAEYTFAVKEAMKGAEKDGTVTVKTPADEEACGYPFRSGGTYTVWAINSRAGGLETSRCTSTGAAADRETKKTAQKVREILNPSTAEPRAAKSKPEEPAPQTPEIPTTGAGELSKEVEVLTEDTKEMVAGVVPDVKAVKKETKNTLGSDLEEIFSYLDQIRKGEGERPKVKKTPKVAQRPVPRPAQRDEVEENILNALEQVQTNPPEPEKAVEPSPAPPEPRLNPTMWERAGVQWRMFLTWVQELRK